MVQTTEISNNSSPPTADRKTGRRGTTLRPPTLMIDLLFGALMLFAFQMGYVDTPVVSHDIQLPTSSTEKNKDSKSIFQVIPVKEKNGNWKFEIPGGKILSTNEVIKRLKKNKKTPVVVLSNWAKIQTYVDAAGVLRDHGVKPTLGVKHRKGKN